MSALPTAKYRLKAIPVKFLPTTRLTELQQTTLKRVRTHRRLHTAGALLRKLRDGGGTLQLETVLQSDDAGVKTDTHIHRTGCPETHSYSRRRRPGYTARETAAPANGAERTGHANEQTAFLTP